MLSSASKLNKFIAPNQLTEEFGGTLQYNHEEWIQNRVVRKKEFLQLHVTQHSEADVLL